MIKKILKNPQIYCFLLFAVCLFTALVPEIALADAPISSAGTQDVDKLAKILVQCVEAVGDIAMLFGVVKYGTAMSSDNPKELTTGITSLVTGAVLANIGIVLGV